MCADYKSINFTHNNSIDTNYRIWGVCFHEKLSTDWRTPKGKLEKNPIIASIVLEDQNGVLFLIHRYKNGLNSYPDKICEFQLNLIRENGIIIDGDINPSNFLSPFVIFLAKNYEYPYVKYINN